MQQLLFLLEAIVAIPLGTLVSSLPWKMAKAFGLLVGKVLFCLDGRDRRQAYHNLDLMYADHPLTQEQKDRLVRRLFLNIGVGAVEFFKIGSLSAGNYRQFVEMGDYRPLLHALEEGKGVLAISAHLGNWEVLGSIVAKLGLNVGAVIKRQENPFTDRWLTNIRERKGKVKCFYHDASVMLHVDRHLKQNGILALMADQRELSRPVFAPFFGQVCPTQDGPARLHLWYEAPIVFPLAIRMDNGKYLLSVDGPYHFETTGDMSEDCREMMAWVNRKYEEMIRKYPDQWFSLLTPRWGHVRFSGKRG
jgi:Kdo2-lipid IVA lauroyltransferase/acyltransferase